MTINSCFRVSSNKLWSKFLLPQLTREKLLVIVTTYCVCVLRIAMQIKFHVEDTSSLNVQTTWRNRESMFNIVFVVRLIGDCVRTMLRYRRSWLFWENYPYWFVLRCLYVKTTEKHDTLRTSIETRVALCERLFVRRFSKGQVAYCNIFRHRKIDRTREKGKQKRWPFIMKLRNCKLSKYNGRDPALLQVYIFSSSSFCYPLVI